MRVDVVALGAGLERGGVNPVDDEALARRDGGVLQALDDGEVRVLQAVVLADEGDAHLVIHGVDGGGDFAPARERGARGRLQGEQEEPRD